MPEDMVFECALLLHFERHLAGVYLGGNRHHV
jgi:hypothetical protein